MAHDLDISDAATASALQQQMHEQQLAALQVRAASGADSNIKWNLMLRCGCAATASALQHVCTVLCGFTL
jgi:hypothetical protein